MRLNSKSFKKDHGQDLAGHGLSGVFCKTQHYITIQIFYSANNKNTVSSQHRTNSEDNENHNIRFTEEKIIQNMQFEYLNLNNNYPRSFRFFLSAKWIIFYKFL